MGKKLELWGALGTVSYLIVIFIKVFLNFDDFQALKLNELGDFLAGVFGPVAFFWLVLGFLQQGRELKLSTDALQLQAQELKNSVEQQSIMAAAATQQIESHRAALLLQEQERDRAISPILTSRTGTRQGGGPDCDIHTSIQIHNAGEEARDVVISFDPSIASVSSVDLGKLTRGAISKVIDFVYPSSEEDRLGICTIKYLRADGKLIEERHDYRIPVENPFVFIQKHITAQH
ncbi:hypothetical protein [Pseudomonas paraveronii]|uniref:hypothetical protein n=1 Tax=Pseudomonas paraveronii TaxID=3040598 RepID=UPI002AB21321|nr:hypothetical protein [Pseudomonas sp. FLM 11]